MNDKKKQILEAAIKCFADKGYQATSIQEIADSLGIAKGSLYFYFKSKEDLLVSICKYYFERIVVKFWETMEDPHLTPREKLIRQVIDSYEQFVGHSDFVKVLMKERFEVNQEIHELIFSLRAQQLSGNQQCIVELYGEEIRPVSYDVATIFISMINGYMGFVIMEQIKLDFKMVSEFLLDRLDDIVDGMLAKQTKPILNTEEFEKFFASNPKSGRTTKAALAEELHAIRLVVEKLNKKPEELDEINMSLQVLEAELDKKEPQVVMVKGMIALLKSLKIPELKRHLIELEAYIS
ncbi:TetR/AcrR family transcriptional regulator [Paenibacillus psychroresistens]|uniref:TetR/AcrR family transcriptional regulator n=1 Tax=Paenibacillus psychroresistens TaxID=1778678 RepID=UPI0013911473|nr:TetR/AcrR family transcriptional regulator [Paenibacillus psychroresistens]